MKVTMDLVVDERDTRVELGPSLAIHVKNVATFNSCTISNITGFDLWVGYRSSVETSDESELANIWFCSGAIVNSSGPSTVL